MHGNVIWFGCGRLQSLNYNLEMPCDVNQY